jgi:tetratricopeptide (TPR) repeat protein
MAICNYEAYPFVSEENPDTHRKNPDTHNPGAVGVQYLSLFSLEQYDEALARGRVILNSYPDEYRIHYIVGSVLLRQGNKNEAIKHFSRALNLAPDFKEAQDGLNEAQKAQSI